MKIIVIASENPVKKNATIIGFGKMFPNEGYEFIAINIPSGVSEQPMNNRETLLGAESRARQASKQYPEADYWVGIEGGIEENEKGMFGFAWVVILSSNLKGIARTGAFILPSKIAELIRKGVELGDADDIVFGVSNSKKNNGAVGLLTNNVINRSSYYAQAVILALIPFKNPSLYKE